MLKMFIFTVMSTILAVYAGFDFSNALEKASSDRVADKDGGRILDLGTGGRIIFSIIFVGVMILLGYFSSSIVLVTVVSRTILVISVLLNIFLRINDIRALKTFSVLWLGNLIASLKDTNFTPADRAGQMYVIMHLVALLLLILGTWLGNLVRYYRLHKDELDEKSNKSESDDSEKSVGKESENVFLSWLQNNWEIIFAVLLIIGFIVVISKFFL